MTKLCRLLRTLIPRFPQDVLLALEEGHLLRAAGRNQEAAAVYRKIWQAGKDGHYPALHYEMAALSLGRLAAQPEGLHRRRGRVRTSRPGSAARS